jgi:predicted acylesterase/phospholipase RssA
MMQEYSRQYIKKIKANDSNDGRALFDLVAGTASGAMNAAILVCNAIDNG